MIGKRFGMLEVVEVLGSSLAKCICDCGRYRTARVGHLNAGYFKSCGCHVVRHGHGGKKTRTREYTSYHNMLARCGNKNNKRYSDYGGKGIKVCDRWLNSFVNFLEDMGECPEGYQIDRIDNTEGYSPDNCKWVSRRENQSNRMNSIIYIVNGKEFSSSVEAGKEHDVSSSTIIHWCGRRKRKDGSYYDAKKGCGHRYKYNQACNG